MRSSICLTFIGFRRCTKNPYKHRFIAGSSKCSTKPLSILLTKLLTLIKQGLQKYCETAYSRSGINQMWILKNSKELLGHLKSPNLNLITNTKSFDFLPFTQPFLTRNVNGNRRYKYLVSGREGTLFCKETLWFEQQVYWRRHHLDARVSSWQHFVVFAGKVFQQIIGIPMGTNYAPLLADIFLYSYEAEFIQSLLSTIGNGWHLSSILHIDTI